ncbi:hypothetical protein VPH35_001810 [Triticum aestivum]
MSRNSGLRMVSSSTAKTWLLALPLFWGLKRPRNWLGDAMDRFLVGATKKARPLPPTVTRSVTMANTKVVEKDRATVPLVSWKRRGVGWKALPLSWDVMLVSASLPSGSTTVMPSRSSRAPAKPL